MSLNFINSAINRNPPQKSDITNVVATYCDSARDNFPTIPQGSVNQLVEVVPGSTSNRFEFHNNHLYAKTPFACGLKFSTSGSGREKAGCGAIKPHAKEVCFEIIQLFRFFLGLPTRPFCAHSRWLPDHQTHIHYIKFSSNQPPIKPLPFCMPPFSRLVPRHPCISSLLSTPANQSIQRIFVG